MRRQSARICYFLLLYLIGIFLYSCIKSRQDRYISQLKMDLPTYDSLTAVLISKYAARSVERPTIIYPAEKDRAGDHFRIYDTSIHSFCHQNDISYIQVQAGEASENGQAADVRYYLSDPNFQYLFHSQGFEHNAPFENTRVRIVPINNNWQAQYEKPNF